MPRKSVNNGASVSQGASPGTHTGLAGITQQTIIPPIVPGHWWWMV
jgi:hypothetical protein